MKKKNITFAATSPKSFCRHEIAVAIFMTVCLLSAKDKGLSIHNGLLHSCRNLTLASSWRDSLSYFKYFNFSYMPKSMKSESKSKYSTLALPSFHETELQLKQAVSLPEISQVLITLCEQLGRNTELHVHFVINDNHTSIEQINGGCNTFALNKNSCDITQSNS